MNSFDIDQEGLYSILSREQKKTKLNVDYSIFESSFKWGHLFLITKLNNMQIFIYLNQFKVPAGNIFAISHFF